MPGLSVPAPSPRKGRLKRGPGRPKGVTGNARPPKSDPEAPLYKESDIARDIYKNTDLPMWVIRKVLTLFFASFTEAMEKGKLIHITGIGSFVPYRRGKGGWGIARLTNEETYIRYRWKISETLRGRIKQATERKEHENTEG